jgi:hypothetical protein
MDVIDILRPAYPPGSLEVYVATLRSPTCVAYRCLRTHAFETVTVQDGFEFCCLLFPLPTKKAEHGLHNQKAKIIIPPKEVTTSNSNTH